MNDNNIRPAKNSTLTSLAKSGAKILPFVAARFFFQVDLSESANVMMTDVQGVIVAVASQTISTDDVLKYVLFINQ